MINPYLPKLAKIEEIKEETPTVKTFKLKLLEGSITFLPGQFILISLFGMGEAPISISSSPSQNDFEITVRGVGNVTNALHRSNKGDMVGIRGPYGNGYPLEEMKNKNVVTIAGGIGLPPIRSLLEYIKHHRKKFGKVWLMYGAKDPSEIVFQKELREWELVKDFEVLVTVDKPTSEWKGYVGVVTTLFDRTKVQVEGTLAVVCGPSIMMHFVVQTLQKLGFANNQIFLSMERLMQCGIGKCGHCNIGGKYVCRDGPVFSYEELTQLMEKPW